MVGKVQPGLSWDIGTHYHRTMFCLYDMLVVGLVLKSVSVHIYSSMKVSSVDVVSIQWQLSS